MKKQLQNKTVYQPNRRTKITVVNSSSVDQDTSEHFGYDIFVFGGER